MLDGEGHIRVFLQCHYCNFQRFLAMASEPIDEVTKKLPKPFKAVKKHMKDKHPEQYEL